MFVSVVWSNNIVISQLFDSLALYKSKINQNIPILENLFGSVKKA